MNKLSGESVAVIMSVYRSDKLNFVIEAVDSIISQSYSDMHIYIYRDGLISEDVELYLDSLCKEDKRVCYFKSKENKGLAFALNYLIEQCMKDNRIEYIVRMDSDDIAHPERIAKQVEFMKNSDADASGTFCEEFGASFSLAEKKVPTAHEEIVNFSITRCPFIHPTMIFRRRVFENKNVRYPTNTSHTEDMALWFLLIDRGFKLANLDLVLLKYRMDEDTVNRRRGLSKSISEIRLRLKYMFKFKKFSMINLCLIVSRTVFHILPGNVLKIVYSNFRG
ncbi:TPA: glycosyltransferase [Vibrio parahaemolyticus]|nr:glycosyltransferase [Vibrio parahaemolyticus]